MRFTDSDALAAALSGRYAIERLVGEGGMAKVYLARDLRHNRQVALKVLRPDLGAVLGVDRFQAEIQVTANLQHPNLLPLFDSGAAGDLLFYVMPFVAGESLRHRIDREKQLPVDEAVRIATAIAAALDYAHRKGVVHRDLKPENVLLHEGQPLVADFGIALAISNAGGARITQTGLSLGTPQYMSPEQATGDRAIDARTDIYSLGALTYEMLAGEPPHTGTTAQAIIARVLTEKPRAIRSTRPSVPENVEAAVERALEKLPADRFENAKAFSDALAAPTFGYSTARHTGPQTANVRAARRFAIAMSVVAAVAIAVAGWTLKQKAPTAAPASLDLELPVPITGGQDVTVSPDGSMLAYTGRTASGQTAIFLRNLRGEPDFRMLPGTEGSSYPSFSPDNQQILFRRNDGAFLRMSVGGGGLTTILTSENGYHPHWGTQDRIVYGGPAGSWVSAINGGTPKLLRRIGGRQMFLLPDGSGVLGRGADGEVVLYDLRTDSLSTLVRSGSHPVYVPGYLLFNDDQGGLSAIRFDLRRHRVSGLAVRVVDRVASSAAARGYSVSSTGTLVWRVGAASMGPRSGGTSRLVIYDFDGHADTLPLPAARPSFPRFSPNGRSIAYSSPSRNPNTTDIYTYDLVSKTNTQITFDGNNTSPIWSPDGRRIVYAKADSGPGFGTRLHIKAADNSGADEVLEGVQPSATPTAWPRDDLILYTLEPGRIMMVAPRRDAKPQPYDGSRDQASEAVLTRDGKYATYNSNEGGTFNVWMRDFPNPIGKWKLSASHGGAPRWSSDGKFLYYVQLSPPSDTLWRVPVDWTPSIVVRAPVVVAAPLRIGVQQWDLHPDGKRFIATVSTSTSPVADAGPRAPSRYVVILNWLTEVEAALAKAK